MLIPGGFNMTVQLHPERYTSAEIFTEDEILNHEGLIRASSLPNLFSKSYLLVQYKITN
jgi:hypothetical protein